MVANANTMGLRSCSDTLCADDSPNRGEFRKKKKKINPINKDSHENYLYFIIIYEREEVQCNQITAEH